VRPCSVVVLHVLGQYLAQMALVDDQQPVGEFSPQGAYDSFADGVRSGRLRGRARTLMPSAANRASKESVNWPARSLIRNLTEAVRWPRSIRSGGLLVSSTLCLPKISSALVGVLSGSGEGRMR